MTSVYAELNTIQYRFRWQQKEIVTYMDTFSDAVHCSNELLKD